MSTSETPESFQVKRTLRVYIDRWPQLNEVLKFILNQEAELTAAKAEIPDGYKLAADTLPEQIKLMHAGLTAFHKNGEALEQSRDAWKKMAENLFNELLYFKEWAITLNSLIDHKATPESFDKLNETLNTYEKLLKEDA